MSELTHIDENGKAVMVDVSDKPETKRMARAVGRIRMSHEAFIAAREGNGKKGDVLQTARIAGIMAAKNTSSMIPLCHPLLITKIDIDFSYDEEEDSVICECTVRLNGQTGAEMEALTGVSVSLLTIYDMCKAIDKGMVIEDIHLVEKDGGKSGHYVRRQ